MKITTFLLFVAFMHVSAAGLAQKVTLVKKDVTLKEVFKEINKQTGYNVFAADNLINNVKPFDANFKDMGLLEVLNKCLENTQLTFTINDKNIVITKRDAQKVAVPEGQPQSVIVNGKVANELGEPMAGVTVKQKTNPSNGTVTDAKGNYIITLPDDKTVMVFSFIGYESQELAAKDISTGSTVTLKAAENNLKEVVISKGYYNEKQALSTGDVSVVSAKEIAEQPVSDPLLTLEGRVPGLYIQQTSGIPGANSTVRIMGQNSIANGNDPLYIIDGVPYSSTSLSNTDLGGGAVGSPSNGPGLGLSPFNFLNPHNIQSIEVLKDADATAIYGSRGSNGVILITTKTGKAGDTKIDVNIFSGVGKVTRTMDLLNTPQYLEMRHEAYLNDGRTPPSYANDINGVWDTTRYTNWQKVLIGNPEHFTNAQLTISGGTTNTQFLVDGGYGVQGTVFPGNYADKKGSLHFSLNNASINDRFHMQLTASYVNDNSDLPSADLTKQITLAPDAPPLYDKNGNLNWALVNGNYTWINPIAYTLQHYQANTNNLISSGNLSYAILPGLLIQTNLGYSIQHMDQNILNPASDEPPPYNTMASFRSADFATNEQQSWIVEPQLSYHRQLAKGKLDLLLGSTFQQNTFSSLAVGAVGYPTDASLSNFAAASNFLLAGDHNTLYRYNALFGRVSYNLDDKYLINFTARRDGSSRFGPGKQFGNFGAVGAAWIFSSEKWVSDALPFLSFGKLRGSYGITGNDQIGDYQYQSTYSSNSATYQGVTLLTPTSLTNPNFSWEVVKKLQFSLELGFAKDRILLSGTYYRNRDGNQLVGYTLPAVTGFTSVQENFPALVQNSGLELSMNTINVSTSKFTWKSSINFTLPQNKLIAFPGIANTGYQYSYEVGHSLFSTYVFHETGVNPTTGQYQYYSPQNKGYTSMPNYPLDLVLSNPVTQTFFGGFQNSFTYKGFSLDVLVQFVKQLGRNYAAGNAFQLPGVNAINQPTLVLDRWQQPGDQTNIGRFSASRQADPSGYLVYSDFSISDASFIRLKNLSLSYELPVKWKKRAMMQNARLYFQCQNLFTITKYAGLDPETQGLTLPPLRMITCGLQFTL